MNPYTVWAIFSFRKELKYVTLTFLAVLLLPFVAVIILTQTGINIISDTLVEVDEVTQEVEIKDPLDGEASATISGPFTWPTNGVVTLEFGESSAYQPLHTGIDIAGKRGDPVTPFYPGIVTYAGQTAWGYGKHIIIDHDNNVTSIYGHLDSMYVVTGEEVKPGDIIGGQGNTGWTVGPTGVHLHFQVNVYGVPVNPRTFLGSNEE